MFTHRKQAMTPYRIRLRRSMLDRVLGGVCGGIGECLGISGWWVRAASFALAITSLPFGLLIYALLWVSIPMQRADRLPPLVRPGEAAPARYTQPESVLLLGALAILIGAIALADKTGVLQASGGGDLLPPVMLLLIGLVILFKHLRGIP